AAGGKWFARALLSVDLGAVAAGGVFTLLLLASAGGRLGLEHALRSAAHPNNEARRYIGSINIPYVLIRL
ncbi:MAG: hypothetical protein RLZZ192_1694, partial [Pseudomonadota bacterium]